MKRPPKTVSAGADKADPRPLLSTLPSVDRLLAAPELAAARKRVRHDVLVAVLREELDARRGAILSGRAKRVPSEREFARAAAATAEALLTGGMRRVINATGVILHTGLGRAVLPEQARARLAEITLGNTDLEFHLDTGQRGQREDRSARMLRLLTGAEDALVLNNNAAAVSLMLMALCNRKEVIVSRGQQVEIGGGFRIPDVIRRSGAKLVEVGCTNRTHLSDFEEAITPRTAAILRVHPSNYRVIGFAGVPDLDELAPLCRERGILLLDDLGSGALVAYPGVPDPEPLVQQSLAQGADLVSFSGDKVLGGPQAGILLGRKPLIRKLARHPLMRAFRCDKLVLAALEATLQLYLERGGEAPAKLPVWAACNESQEAAVERAGRLFRLLAAGLGHDRQGPVESSFEVTGSLNASLRRSTARTGSGALPEQDLPSAALFLSHATMRAERLHRKLRAGRIPVVGQVRDEEVVLDVKMVREDELQLLTDLVLEAIKD